MAGDELRVSAEELGDFVQAVFERVGLSARHAAEVTDTLVAAELRGTVSHGVMRLPFYVRRLQDGGAKRDPSIRIVQEDLGTALVEGDGALGQITATYCTRLSIAKARQCGVGCVTARGSDHIGAVGYYAMLAAREGMIGIGWTNSFPGMAPWGGRENRICNNPLAVAVPAGRHDPIVLDMAMSVVAGGKVRMAAKLGERIPLGWVVDKSGRNTEDPNDLPAGGALLPFGYKGYGLAVIGEVLSGILSGARILSEIPQWFACPDQPVGNGHFHLTLDIGRFVPIAQFTARVDEMIDRLKSTPPMEGVEEVLVPGEPEARAARERQRDGIPLPEPVLRDLCSLAETLHVPLPTALRIGGGGSG
jgi:LDH2 family malate/lactate/ureidoglycolate dehydrogenase